MGVLDDLNESTNNLGGKYVKLTQVEHGTVKGSILDSELRDKTFDGEVVLARKTGKPRKELVLTLQTDERDDDDANDDGIRKLSLDEGGRSAVADAKKELGRAIEIGDVLTIKVTKSSVQGKHGADYKAKLEPGKVEVVADVEADEW